MPRFEFYVKESFIHRVAIEAEDLATAVGAAYNMEFTILDRGREGEIEYIDYIPEEDTSST